MKDNNIYISQDEKIDYIFETLKKQEKRHKWSIFYKIIFRLFIVLYILYFIFIWHKILLNKIDEYMKDTFKVDINTESLINKEQIQKILNNF